MRHPYCVLRYLSHVMEPECFTPTADCFQVLLRKLTPVVATNRKKVLKIIIIHSYSFI